MKTNIKDFTDLEVWKRCNDIKINIYNIVKTLPEDEKYGLVSQMRRASISITANIAEGYGRFHFQENIQFFRQTRGSLYELKDHIRSCFQFKYINKDMTDTTLSKIETAVKIVNGYIRMLKRSKNSAAIIMKSSLSTEKVIS